MTPETQVFIALKKIIPDLPKTTRKLVLTVECGSVPTVECVFSVTDPEQSTDTQTQTFELHPRTFELSPVENNS